MPRPKVHPEQHLRAYGSWQHGLGPSAIEEKLYKEFGDETVSTRTIATWIKGFKELKQETVVLDAPFQWHLLDRFEMPWEASSFVMRMLGDRQIVYITHEDGSAFMQKAYGVWSEEFIEDMKVPGNRVSLLTPTVRDVRWWWRVHQAAPEVGRDVGEFEDLYHLATSFAYRELCSDILGLPLDLADLEACLVNKPWLDEKRHRVYHQLIDLNIIPRLKDVWQILESRQALLEGESPVSLFGIGYMSQSLFPIDRDHPELLMSQQWDNRKALWNNDRKEIGSDGEAKT